MTNFRFIDENTGRTSETFALKGVTVSRKFSPRPHIDVVFNGPVPEDFRAISEHAIPGFAVSGPNEFDGSRIRFSVRVKNFERWKDNEVAKYMVDGLEVVARLLERHGVSPLYTAQIRNDHLRGSKPIDIVIS